MGTSDLDWLIASLPHSNLQKPKLSDIRNHPCKSSTQKPQTANPVSGTLNIQVPSSAEELKVHNHDDTPQTPRSVEHKIPELVACPPAPRKTKQVLTTGKRRACFPVVRSPDEFVAYMDAMLALNETVYVPDIVVNDLFGAGHHVKRLKLLQPPAHEL